MFARFISAGVFLSLACLVTMPVCGQNLVTNGGFETGNLSGWTQSGNTAHTSVTTGSAIIGTYGLHTGPVTTEGYISQTFATTPGDHYDVRWWLFNEGATADNHFSATFGSTTIANDTNLATGTFWNFLRGAQATSTSTTLTFGFRNNPSYFRFDDVSAKLDGHQLLSASSTGAGYVLVHNTGYSVVTAANVGDSNTRLTGQFGGATGPFGSSSPSNLYANVGLPTSRYYSYTPTQRGYNAESVLVSTYGGSQSVTLSGQGVAPVNSVWASGNPGLTRIGTSNTVYVYVQNAGDGNLAGSSWSNYLQGYANAYGTGFSGPSYQSLTLSDGALVALPCTFSPYSHGVQAGTVYTYFYNGDRYGTNNSDAVTTTLSGQGVGPVFASTLDGNTLTPGATINFGDVWDGDTASKLLSIGNTTTDPGGLSLTGLTLLSAAFSGPDASDFSLTGFTPGTQLSAGLWDQFTLNFSATGTGLREAWLTFYTDQLAAFGSYGQSFSFHLWAAAVPEPATAVIWAMLGTGVLGMTWRRRKPS